jgi:hypothetical protein
MAEDCASTCQSARALPICQMEFAAFSACSAKAPVMCNQQGKAAVQGCANEGLAYIGCLAGGLDGGLTD